MGANVDDKVKGALGKLFAEDKARKEKVVARENEREQTEAARLEQFNTLKSEVIRPAFQEIADFVTEQGWAVEIHEEGEKARRDRGRETATFDPPRIGLYFARSGKPKPWSHQTPHFSAIANKRDGTVMLHASTIGEGHGGSAGGQGSAAMEDVTTDFLHERITAYLEKLMRDSAPYPRH